jgi:dihydroxyacetone kinase-like protein
MGKTHLTLQETKGMFIFVAERMIAHKDILTEADKAIGDGDHGIGMAKGFEAVRLKMESQDFETLDAMFKAVGMALMSSIGGASGAIFGTLYQGAGRQMGGRTEFDAEALALLLTEGLAAVQKRGKAKLGDMTMVDALEPAASAAREQASASLHEALDAATQAAKGGMESTKDMVATMGRAKSLGDRALGHADPGAISTHLILECMTEYVAGL